MHIYMTHIMQICMEKTRVRNLYYRFQKNNPKSTKNKFFKHLEIMATAYATKNVSTTHPDLLNILAKEFNLHVDSMASPLSFSTKIPFYCSHQKEDKSFGASQDSIDY